MLHVEKIGEPGEPGDKGMQADAGRYMYKRAKINSNQHCHALYMTVPDLLICGMFECDLNCQCH